MASLPATAPRHALTPIISHNQNSKHYNSTQKSAFSQFAQEFSGQTSFLQLVTHIHEAYMNHMLSNFQGQSRPFYELIDEWKEANHRYFPEADNENTRRNKSELEYTILKQERDIKNLRDKLVKLEFSKIKLEQKYIGLEQDNLQLNLDLGRTRLAELSKSGRVLGVSGREKNYKNSKEVGSGVENGFNSAVNSVNSGQNSNNTNDQTDDQDLGDIFQMLNRDNNPMDEDKFSEKVKSEPIDTSLIEKLLDSKLDSKILDSPIAGKKDQNRTSVSPKIVNIPKSAYPKCLQKDFDKIQDKISDKNENLGDKNADLTNTSMETDLPGFPDLLNSHFSLQGYEASLTNSISNNISNTISNTISNNNQNGTPNNTSNNNHNFSKIFTNPNYSNEFPDSEFVKPRTQGDSPMHQYQNMRTNSGYVKRKRDEKTCAHCGEKFQTRENQRGHAKVCKHNARYHRDKKLQGGGVWSIEDEVECALKEARNDDRGKNGESDEKQGKYTWQAREI